MQSSNVKWFVFATIFSACLIGSFPYRLYEDNLSPLSYTRWSAVATDAMFAGNETLSSPFAIILSWDPARNERRVVFFQDTPYSHLNTRLRLETAFGRPGIRCFDEREPRQLFSRCYSRSLIFHCVFHSLSPPRSPRPSNKIDNIHDRVTDLPATSLSSRVPASSRCPFSASSTPRLSVRFRHRNSVANAGFLFLPRSPRSPALVKSRDTFQQARTNRENRENDQILTNTSRRRDTVD